MPSYLMEQLVRRSQAALAIQSYFEAKQIPYGIRVARTALAVAEEQSAVTIDRLRQRQAYDIELANVRNIESQARSCWPISRRIRGSPSASSPWSCTRAVSWSRRIKVRCRSGWTRITGSTSMIPTW